LCLLFLPLLLRLRLPFLPCSGRAIGGVDATMRLRLRLRLRVRRLRLLTCSELTPSGAAPRAEPKGGGNGGGVVDAKIVPKTIAAALEARVE
jgi:hypothetical protein